MADGIVGCFRYGENGSISLDGLKRLLQNVGLDRLRTVTVQHHQHRHDRERHGEHAHGDDRHGDHDHDLEHTDQDFPQNRSRNSAEVQP